MVAAQLVGLGKKMADHQGRLFEDEKVFSQIGKKLRKMSLVKRIEKLTRDELVGQATDSQQLEELLDDGRQARNEFVHGLLSRHSPFKGGGAWTQQIEKPLQELAERIMIADSLLVGLISGITGVGGVPKQQGEQYVLEMYSWLSGHSSSRELGG